MKSHAYSENEYLVTHSVNVDGVRLDAFLKDRYRKRSREQLKRAIDDGAVTVRRSQGAHLSVGKVKPSLQLLAGDEVLVLSEKKPEPEVSFDYKVLFEDELLYVVDKPANLPVHAAGRYFFNTLLTHLKTQGRHYYLPHRLDKETSGVLVLTKTAESCAHITAQFAARETRKRYLAIVYGTPPEEFKVDAPMKRATLSEIELKMAITPESEGGQTALTEFRRLKTVQRSEGVFSLVECLPRTGRQHQIRIHLEHAGHPIVGDKLYGRTEAEALRFFDRKHISAEAQAALMLPRHALHAAGLKFCHPGTNEPVEFTSELPGDLAGFLGSN